MIGLADAENYFEVRSCSQWKNQTPLEPGKWYHLAQPDLSPEMALLYAQSQNSQKLVVTTSPMEKSGGKDGYTEWSEDS